MTKTGASVTFAAALLGAGLLEKCLQELDGCSHRLGARPDFIRLRAECLLRLGRAEQLDEYLATVDCTTDDLAALVGLFRAKLDFRAGNREEALRQIAALPATENALVSGLVWKFRGNCEARLGHFRVARASLQEAISRFERCGERLGIVETLNDLGNCGRVLGLLPLAESCFQQAIKASLEIGAKSERGRASLNLAALYWVLGKVNAASAEFESARVWSRESGNVARASLAELGLGAALCRRGDVVRAKGHLLAAFYETKRNSTLSRQFVVAHEYLGELRLSQGYFKKARILLKRAVSLGQSVGDPELIYEPQYRLAEAELALRNISVARSLAVESRDNFAARGDRLEAAFAGRVAAQALLCDGKWQEAIHELTEIEQTLDQLGEQFEIDRVRRLLDAARSRTKVWDIRLEERVRHLVPETKVAPLKDATCVDPAIICGKSRRFLEFLEQVDQHCRRPLPVLLEGETGVGKELIAHRIHARSDRSGGAFVPFNCGTASPGLFDAEIFGYVKGAFTGADAGRRGLARVAHAGTLFLDEIGEMGRESQARILRLLDSGEVRPVGSDRIERTDIRLIAATHQDLHALVDNGSFRRDLFYRLRTVHLKVPALRERIEDLELLVQHFLDQAQSRAIGTPTGVSDAVFEEMSRYPWPGNVRELRNEIFRLASEYDGKLIRKWSMRPTPTLVRSGATPRDLTEEEVTSALQRTQGSVAEAARLLDVSRNGIYRAVSRLGLDLASFRRN